MGINTSKDAALYGMPFAAYDQLPNAGKWQLHVQSRIYCYVDGRWVAPSEQYGFNIENWNDNRGTGADPTVAWNDMGPLILPGSTIERVHLMQRANNAAVTDWTMRFTVQYPTDPAAWATGFDANGEMTVDELHRSNRSTWTNPDVTATNMNDQIGQTIELNYTVPAAHPFVSLGIQAQATVTGTTTRYVYSSMVFEITHPPA